MYQAIPLVSTERWSPTSSSATALVYATMNPMTSVATKKTNDFGAPLSANFTAETAGEVHSSTLPLVASSALAPPTVNYAGLTTSSHGNSCNSPFAYVTQPAHNLSLACDDPIWLDSQEGLFDKHEVSFTKKG